MNDDSTRQGTMNRDSVAVSIIVPVYNNPRDLRECLGAITASGFVDKEIIVVDDGSTDDTPATLRSLGISPLRLSENAGVAAARNYGARHARGEILFFVDADVALHPDAIEKVVSALRQDPGLSAIFGSYDAQPRAQGTVSQYRNLLHHFVHQQGNREAATFWAGCGAVRRSVFEEIGGFDQKRFRYPSIEDIELGYRLRRAGHRILLDKSLQGTHLKRWTLLSFIKTDISRRAIPWSRLILETRTLPNDLNLSWDQRASFLLVASGCALLALGLFQIKAMVIAAAAFLGVLILNRRMYLFFFRQRGLPFALSCIPLHGTYYLYSGFSYLYVRMLFLLRRIAPIRAL